MTLLSFLLSMQQGYVFGHICLCMYYNYLPTKSPKFCGWKKFCRWVYSTPCSLGLNSSSLVSDTNRPVIMFFYENEGALLPWILYFNKPYVLLITLELAQAVQYHASYLGLAVSLPECCNTGQQIPCITIVNQDKTGALFSLNEPLDYFTHSLGM